jgi:hypothetical protein
MFLTKRYLDRRTFLRGMGATVALPFLDAMIPAFGRPGANAVPRLAFVYFPHGAIMSEWTPAAGGHEFQLGRVLEPLAPFRNRLTIVSGLENRHAYGPVHAITPGTWLSGASPRLRRGSGEALPLRQGSGETSRRGDAKHGMTADQLAADHLSRDLPLTSLTVAAEEPRKISAGIWQGEYDESYGTTIAFRDANVPVPMEFRPRAVFDTLFHSTEAGNAPAPTSILDRVAADAAGLRRRLGTGDRVALAEYLDAIRDVECRVGAPDEFGERIRVMFDLIALAFRADVTRVASMMMAAEASSVTYHQLGVNESFHLLSHHQNDPEKIEKLVAIQAYHTRMFAAFVRTLAESPDGDGSILDRSLILFGSNMSDSHAHDHFPLPVAVIGGGCGTIRGGQHLACPDRTPISNLLLTLLNHAGVPVRAIGDSTGGSAL